MGGFFTGGVGGPPTPPAQTIFDWAGFWGGFAQMVVFFLKIVKSCSRTFILGKFVVFLADVPEKSRIFGLKISRILEQMA